MPPCYVSMIHGSVKVHQGKKRARVVFSSDGDSRVIYRCQLDKGNFEPCELIYIRTYDVIILFIY